MEINVLISKILHYYKECLPHIESCETYDEAYTKVHEFNIEYGVCNTSSKIFGDSSIYQHVTIQEYIVFGNEYSGYWTKVPKYCCSKSEIIKSIKTRISIMNKILENETEK